MQVTSSNQPQINPYLQNNGSSNSTTNVNNNQRYVPEDVQEIIHDSSLKVTISMNAQVILEAAKMSEGNTVAQQNLLSFLGGKETSDGFSLEDIGYTGKPITELSQEEASELLGENGFFGVNQTSNRVASFVLNFAGDDLELLEEGRKGIIQGFEEAEKLFGGELPEISYQTQERTLALIDEKINQLKNGTNNSQQ